MEDQSISLMSPSGYLLCYHREKNKLVITLPQTEDTMMTTGEISHRRTNLMTSELDLILRMVQAVFEGEYLDAPPDPAANPITAINWVKTRQLNTKKQEKAKKGGKRWKR